MDKYNVQWAAQFAVAAELARRGYSAAFFLGNQPAYDLICKGSQDFKIQVKGFAWPKPKSSIAKGGYVLVADLFTSNANDLIVIVHAPKPPSQFEFYIATRKQLAAARRSGSVNPKTGKPYANFPAGICYRDFEGFRDNWAALPPA